MRIIFLDFLVALSMVFAAYSRGGVSANATRGKTLFNQTTLDGVAIHTAKMIMDPIYTRKARTVEEYLREFIISPNSYVENGFIPGVMYPEFGKDLSEQEIEDLFAFLRILK